MATYGQDLDYTASDLGLDPAAPEEIVLGAVSLGEFGFDADKAEQENGFRDVPPGVQTLIVSDVKVDKDQYVKVFVDGKPSGYCSHSAIIRYCLPGDKRATISDFFLLPPSTPIEQEAYFKGVPQDKPDAAPGFNANKFFHFADRLGLVDKRTKVLTPQGQRPTTWKGRPIVAEVVAGKGTYTNKRGETVARGPQIKMFSYKPANGAPTPSASPSHPGQSPAPASRPAAPQPSATVDDVLANI